ncbi:VOC family protein [Aureispira anguillae]|uniref:VOC family protein n=1 Tax=Aureispira anguillae TaxID=2864201 RepID=A0A916DVI4_9BACT|nr:VOC family protein [Aureispira anguillae]BDS15174.1 VOC family protein [Aureispira anguillae]
MQKITPFHVAIPVHNLEEARTFYVDVLQCKEGRSSEQWIDFDLYGHQFVVHHQPNVKPTHEQHFNQVDGQGVPVPHYGVVLEWETWEQLAQRLSDKNITFAIEPYIRFKGQVGEQATMFFFDPSGNALEFKAFKDMSTLFAK